MIRSADDPPVPGDLFLDEALPACERVTLVRNGWRAEATHVWVGSGWARLAPGPVFPVPDHVPHRRSVGAPRSGGSLRSGAPAERSAPTPGRARAGDRSTTPEATPGRLPGPAPHSALDLELSEAEPRRLVRSARRR